MSCPVPGYRRAPGEAALRMLPEVEEQMRTRPGFFHLPVQAGHWEWLDRQMHEWMRMRILAELRIPMNSHSTVTFLNFGVDTPDPRG